MSQTKSKSKFENIRKRDGRIVAFDQNKVTKAIFKSFLARGKEDKDLAQEISDKVVETLNRRFKEKIPNVEQIQDIVIEVLDKEGYKEIAEGYSLYRQKRKEIRDNKWWLLSQDVKTKLSLNALQVLESRYLKKDDQQKVIETPQQLFQRVAANIASAETFFKPSISDDELFKIGEKFYRMMASLEFLPNSPTLMNAGVSLQQLSGCFVLPVGDSMEEIFEAVKNTALVHQTGGGTGFDFSSLRPKGDIVKSTQGNASGPLSFMTVFNAATEVIKQGGKRRGANMGILRVDHPDILEFITCKLEEGALSNFNISVAITDKFMEAVKKKKGYDLISPRDGQIVKKLDANKVFDLIVNYAWENGEPGVIFIDRINRDNPTPKMGKIESTNPCHGGRNRVHTDKGLVKIKDLVNKEFRVVCPNGKIVSARAFPTGVKSLYSVSFDNGICIDLTSNHKLISKNGGEKKIKDLRKGDKIALSERIIDITNPKYQFTEEDGFVLGWNYGDGWITWNTHSSVRAWQIGFVFSLREDLSVFKKVKEYLSKKGIRTQGTKRIDRGVIEVALTNKKIRMLFLEKFKASNKRKGIPETVMQGNKEFMIGFLRGIFSSDGSVRIFKNGAKRARRIILTSAHEKLIKDVQLLLSFFGITSRIRMSYTYLQGKTYKRFDLFINGNEIEKFNYIIGFPYSGSKNKKLKHILSLKWKRRETKDYCIVVNIEKLGKKERVFNLTVDDKSHRFVVNGIVSGNCGEQPLLPNESCNLGSINLSKMIKKNGRNKWSVDWDKLGEITHDAIRFLDNVIEVNRYPLQKIEELTKGNRKVGLGVMGWADMLLRLGVPYNSKRALSLAGKIMKFIQDESKKASAQLAEERDVFPNFKDSIYNEKNILRIRNATTTTIAPTGTISIIAGSSSAIEPLFAVSFIRKHVLGNQEMVEVNPIFEEVAKERGFWSKELIEEVADKGSIQNIKGIPADVKKVFITALDISPEDHIKTQAAFQKYVDNAVSKTINFPLVASKDDVKKSYLLSYKLGCKGMTLYRNESRKQQVLNIRGKEQGSLKDKKGPIKEKEVSPELRDPSPDVPDLPPGSCPTCNI
ncbi:MAG: ribonucleotide reductase N-terminal alpha domain-containing protein [Candidatus Portnoybacteria bacterium]